jgi:hypothetical protein
MANGTRRFRQRQQRRGVMMVFRSRTLRYSLLEFPMIPSLRWVLGLALVLSICWLTGPLPAGQGDKDEGRGQPGKKEIDKTKHFQRIAKLLDTPVDLKALQGQEVVFKEAIVVLHDLLAQRDGELNVLVNADAFKEENPDAPDIYDTKIKFPALPKQLPAGEALLFMLAQVPTNNATFLVKRDYLEVTTVSRASPAALLATRVLARFDKTPLEDALMDLADQTGATIILDARIAEKARVPVSANLRNTITLEGAVRLLTGMTELQMTVDDDIIFITEKKAKAAGPKTTLEFRKRRIDRALEELADWANVTIVLDPDIEMPDLGPGGLTRRRAGAVAFEQPLRGGLPPSESMLVTAKLRPNVSPEAAVRVLADMVGLAVMAKDNLYYVTTPEKAQALRMDQLGKQQLPELLK